jgi:hypothetical protein
MGQTEAHGYVASATLGRTRIRIHPAHRELLPKVKAHLEIQPGIGKVETQVTTGSVVVHYHRQTTSHEGVLEMLRVIGILVHDDLGAKLSVLPRTNTDAFEEDRGMVTRAGPLVIDWPRSIGYFGAVGLAVAFELIPAPLGAFVAAIPFLKLLKRPTARPRTRFIAAILEGAAIPVGGESESVIRLAKQTRHRRDQDQAMPQDQAALAVGSSELPTEPA